MKRMIMLKCFILTLLGGFVLEVVVHAQDQSGFISIDCGLAEDSNYTDDTTGIAYSTDAAFIDTGLSNSILSEFITNSLELQLWTVRSFPEGSRNCYNLSAAQGKGKKYLIRAAFMYGNYDNQDQVPKFELHLGADLWDTVEPENASTIIKKEIIHVPLSNYIYVCLVNTNFGTPFISALELRLLSYSMYPTQSELESLASFSRLDFGSSSTTKQVVRYPDDFYDRIWFPFNTPADWVSLSTSLAINTANIYEPPFTVMSTAVMPRDVNQSLNFYWDPVDPTTQFYIYMHFAELEILTANQTREFNICLDNKLWFGPLDPVFLSTSTIFSTTWGSKAVFDYSFVKTQKSDLQPIINALEIYIVKRFLESQTDEDDAFFSIPVSPSPVSVSAIVNIKSLYGVMRNWQGDPCAPKAYLWEGLDCSYNGHDPPRIIYLNLSSSGLTGVIPPFISNLTLIQSLDLSNNSLTGPLPEFLSQLRFLKVLNLKGNKFSGPIPVELIERAKNGSLSLSIDGYTPNSCQSVPCKKKNKLVVPVIASVAALSIILLTALVVFWSLKWRKRRAGMVNSMPKKEDGVLELRNWRFSYSEIIRITNNFNSVLGRGGFGTVYHGYLDNTQVAVKMLSQSSIQGYKEFQTEAELLTRVHHRNLTSLVGYFHEGGNMGLIYEYMANGNLRGHLSNTNPNVLSWVQRLQIARDAAQGLDYLHNGCKPPPIVHRDVKSSNILLDENFQAKLADFGLSRTCPIEGGTYVSKVIGTPGYLDPEYYETNRLNEKSDVFSFGIVLLELITGRPAIAKREEKGRHILQWVNFMLETRDIGNIIDPRLEGEFDTNSVWKAVKVAMACVSHTSIKRPTMTLVLMELKECLAAEKAGREAHESDLKDIIGMMDGEIGPW